MYTTKTIGELAEMARQQFRAHLKGSDGWLWPNNIYVTAKVIAGMTFEVLGFASYISRQKFAHTAPDLESLLLHGEELGIPQKPASAARGTIVVTSDGPVTVNTGAVFRRSDMVSYRVISGGSQVTAGSIDVSVIAVADGRAGNAPASTPVEIVSGVTGNALASVGADGIVLGEDVEDIESYRARILFRKRNPPHGGAPADYVIWATEVSGVTRVFIERRWAGPGTVRVFVLMDELYPSGVPTGADVARVSDHIEMVSPAGAIVAVEAPVAQPIDIEISGMSPNTVAVREAVLAELRDMFRRRSRVAGNDVEFDAMPFLACPITFSRSWIGQAVANAAGEDRHTIIEPAADVSIANGCLPTLGNVTFT